MCKISGYKYLHKNNLSFQNNNCRYVQNTVQILAFNCDLLLSVWYRMPIYRLNMYITMYINWKLNICNKFIKCS